MTFPQIEGSVADGSPVQLYRFVYGDGDDEFLGYTSYTDTLIIDHGGSVGEIEYAPIPANRENIVSNGTLDKSTVKISLDVSTDLAELFRVYPPSSVVTLTIYEGHVDDPDFQFEVIWAGRIVAAERVKSELHLSGEPVSTQMRRPGLRAFYQYGCRHALYRGLCVASKAAATVSATVAAIDGTVVTLSSGWEGAFAPDKFIRGTLEWTPSGETTRVRTILRVSGDELTISGLPLDLAVSDAVDVVLGCNHRAFATDDGDCEALHNVLPAFGGQPWIPLKNVVNKNPYY